MCVWIATNLQKLSLAKSCVAYREDPGRAGKARVICCKDLVNVIVQCARTWFPPSVCVCFFLLLIQDFLQEVIFSLAFFRKHFSWNLQKKDVSWNSILIQQHSQFYSRIVIQKPYFSYLFIYGYDFSSKALVISKNFRSRFYLMEAKYNLFWCDPKYSNFNQTFCLY